MVEPLTSSATIEFAPVGGKVAVLRLIGRCSHQNSAYLTKAADLCQAQSGPCVFVLDLERCEHMDSTFLGVLAGLAQRQSAQGLGKMIAVNASARLLKILTQLGLNHLMEIREQMPSPAADQEIIVDESSRVSLSRVEQIVHMIQAHEKLVEVDSRNEVEFRDVLKCLSDSLARATAQSEADRQR
ncbi:MAG: STAS domain-containing protein [Candidatus Sumerlaeia bacterium]|nr:STAS domain-containing protein [Candidatus Sumerlaeia bacterium]